MAGGERNPSKNYRPVPTRLNEAYLALLADLDGNTNPHTPFDIVIRTGEALREAGLFVQDPPTFDIAEIVDRENELFEQTRILGTEDVGRISRSTVAAMAKAGLLDRSACDSLVQ